MPLKVRSHSWRHSLHIQRRLRRFLFNLLTPPLSQHILHFKEEPQSPKRSVNTDPRSRARAALSPATAKVGRAPGPARTLRVHLRQLPRKYQVAEMQTIRGGRPLPWIQRGHSRAAETGAVTMVLWDDGQYETSGYCMFELVIKI